jgi:signal transduction histidine kinase
MAVNKMMGALKVMRAQLSRAERLVALGKMVSALAYNLRNPLRGSRGAAPVGWPASDHDEDAATFAEIINRNERLERWVNGLLSYLRPLHLYRFPCDVNQLIEDALSTLGQKLTAKAVQPILHRALLPKVAADPLWMEQALLAIFTNAIEASAQGGRIVITSGADAALVSVAITDGGRGVPRAIQERAFDPYCSTKPGGSG